MKRPAGASTMTVISGLLSNKARSSVATAFLLTEKATVHRSLSRHGTYRQMLSLFSSSRSRVPEDRRQKGRLFPEEINIIYDSKCNVCNLEIEFLRRRDLKLTEKRHYDIANNGQLPQPRLKFTDLESSDYNPQDPANGGVTYERGMKSMHAITADGKVVDGVPVFKMAYDQVNLGWLFAVTKIAWVKRIADRGYDLFAKYRTNITRGQNVDALIQAYQEKKAMEEQKQKNLDDCDACAEKLTK